ncbi:MAG: hypothetical protein ACFCBU_01375, partial [Cyanophyceae cyanobacterium]
MTRFRKLKDRSIRNPNSVNGGNDNNNIDNPWDGFAQRIDALGDSVNGLARQLNQEDLDIHDAATIALDALTIIDSVIPGVDIPIVDFERAKTPYFDTLTPVNGLENISAGILPELNEDPFACNLFSGGPMCALEFLERGLDFGAGLTVSFDDNEICIRASVNGFGVEVPLFMVCYRKPSEDEPAPPEETEEDSISLPNTSGSSFNCVRLSGDPPYEYWLVHNEVIESRTEYDHYIQRNGRPFFFSVRSIKTITSNPGSYIQIPSERLEDPTRYLKEQGF